MPRPVNPDAPTKAEYARQRRVKRQLTTVELDTTDRAHIATLRTRDGDPSDRAAVARALRVAVGEGRGQGDE